MTPKEAERLACLHDLNRRCSSDGCMGWRWNRGKETTLYLKAVQEEMKKYDGKGEGTFKVASGTVYKDWQLFHEVEGYCGLAGKPEIGKHEERVK